MKHEPLTEIAPGPALVCDSLYKEYASGPARVQCLSDVSLEVARGEFACILGPSGSGKSSLLNICAGLDKPTAGEVRVLDRSVGSLSPKDLARFRRSVVGTVFQAFMLIPGLTVFQNVELPLIFARMEPNLRRSKVDALLEHVGLGHRAGHMPGELSGGEQQRTSIARALVNSPSVLFADEPTGNLDSVNAHHILRQLKEISRLGTTVVLVTHDRDIGRVYADVQFEIADGRLVSASRGGQSR